jgi:ABC-type nitrate/sulfonate/bicarbonate transport system substrate-binding protein
MLRRPMGILLGLATLLCAAPAAAQTKMTIATGVDPVFSAYYVAQQEGLFKSTGSMCASTPGPRARRWSPSW